MIDDIKHMIAQKLIFWGIKLMPDCKMMRALLKVFAEELADDIINNPKFKKFHEIHSRSRPASKGTQHSILN